MTFFNFFSTLLIAASLTLSFSTPSEGKSKDPEHYTNQEWKNDPDFIPDLQYPAPDSQAAEERYKEMVDSLDPKGNIILDVLKEEKDEISWTSVKNKTAEVLGYFRAFDAYISFEEGKFKKAELLVSVNSIDSAVPGRDHRIRNLFFKSMQPEMGTGVLVLDKVADGSPYISAIQNGASHKIIAEGLFTLGAVTVPVTAELVVMWDQENEILSVQTLKPISLLVSDLQLDGNFPALMKECNHKSMGNRVKIACKLRFE